MLMQEHLLSLKTNNIHINLDISLIFIINIDFKFNKSYVRQINNYEKKVRQKDIPCFS